MKYNQITNNNNPNVFGVPLEECKDIQKLQNIVQELFSLLDNIDTGSDMFKPSDIKTYKHFYDYTMKQSDLRAKYLQSDGYELFIPEE